MIMRKIFLIATLAILTINVFGQITDTGDKVGIGTTTPIAKFHVMDQVSITFYKADFTSNLIRPALRQYYQLQLSAIIETFVSVYL